MSERPEWDPGHYQLVRLIYGMVIGTALVGAGIAFLPHVLDGGVQVAEGVLVGGCILVGLVAALPGTFMQVISWLLSTVRKRNGGEP